MNIDALLEAARPGDALSLRERTELDRLIESAGPRVRRRRGLIIALIAGIVALVFAGGAAGTAIAGVWHPVWYDAASDWTVDVKTVNLVFTLKGVRHQCTVPISLSSTHNGTNTSDFQQALAYLQSTHPEKLVPYPSLIDDLSSSTWVGQGDPPPAPSAAWIYEEAWTISVNNDLGTHLSSIGLDPQKVQIELDAKCDFHR